MRESKQPRASEVAERLVKQLNVAYKAVRLYPPASAIPRESASAVLGTLRSMGRDDPDIRLVVTKTGLYHEGGLAFPGQQAFLDFAREFFTRGLAEVRFHAGTTIDEIISFLRVFDESPSRLADEGGLEARLWEAGVVNISVKEASARVVDADEPLAEASEDEDWPPDAHTIDDILADMSAGRARDEVVLVRLLDSTGALAAYMRESSAGRGTTPPSTWIASRVRALATMAERGTPEQRAARYASIAQGLLELEDDLLRATLRDKLLPEARKDDSIRHVVASMGLEAVAKALVSDLEDTEASRDGLARAIRNLLQMANQDREEVLGAVAVAMTQSGAAPELTDKVMEAVHPARITAKAPPRSTDSSPLEKVLRVVDMAPARAATDDPDASELLGESRAGISDGDVLGALVAIASLERGADRFSSVMSIMEDSLGLLLITGDYRVASVVAESLVLTLGDEERPAEQHARLRTCLDELASKSNMRSVSTAMRRFAAGTDEHEACRKLLSVLGRHAVGPLLEVLADEPDMAARKALVEVISEMAEVHINELGDRLGDSRWYFVRNVVTILGATKTPQTLQLLSRTLRYPDARVRRETIRAVHGIKDALSTEMLIAALEDDDAQNVQLTARYLGLSAAERAIPPLERVASGEGRGNRDTPTRIEAMEALSRLGATGSLPLLQSLTRARGFRGRSKNREVIAAAEAAIRAIRARGAARDKVPADEEDMPDLPETQGEEA